MDYLSVSIETTSFYGEILGDILAEITGGCEIDDPDNIDELSSKSSPRWDYIDEQLLQKRQGPVFVRFYLSADEEGQSTLQKVGGILAQIKNTQPAELRGSLKIEIAPMKNQNWQEEWKKYFKPIEIGQKLIVKPSWEAMDNRENKIILTIDSTLGFGTGAHATTFMCLEELEKMDLAGLNILDLGCGSGILSCATSLLGCRHTVCCDIDGPALNSARENLEINGVKSQNYTLLLGDILTDEALFGQIKAKAPYDVILANIVSDVLIELSPKLGELISKNGVIIMSGITTTRQEEVALAIKGCGFDILAAKTKEDWCALVVRP